MNYTKKKHYERLTLKEVEDFKNCASRLDVKLEAQEMVC